MRLASGDRIEAAGVGLVRFIPVEPKVEIDLNRLNKMYTTPLVLTVEQATELLRELDRIIL
jgi:hypothetical protein